MSENERRTIGKLHILLGIRLYSTHFTALEPTDKKSGEKCLLRGYTKIFFYLEIAIT